MPTLRDLRYYEPQTFKDKSGNVIDLTQSDRNFSPMYDANTGEYVTNPNLQRYMDNPELADLEADLALVKSSGGVIEPEPTRQITTGYEGEYESRQPVQETIVNPEHERYQDYQDRVSAASQRLEQYAAGKPYQPYNQQPEVMQPLQFTGSPEERVRFKQMIIDSKFQGLDPVSIDPMAQVEKMSFQDWQRIYEQQYANSGGQMPLWWDLDQKEKMSWIKSQKSIEYEKAQSAKAVMLDQYKQDLGEYEANVQWNEQRRERNLARSQNAIKRYQAARKEASAMKKSNLDERIDLTKEMEDIEKSVYENRHNPEMMATLTERKKMVLQRFKELAQQQAANRKSPPQGNPPVNVTPGSRHRGAPSEQDAAEAAQMSGLLRLMQQGVSRDDPRYIEAVERTKQRLEDAGFDTTPGQGAPAPQQQPLEPELYQ